MAKPDRLTFNWWLTDPVVMKRLDQLALLVAAQHAEEMEKMSVLSEKLDAIEASQAAMVVRIAEDVAAYEAEIAALQALVDTGVATPDELARLDAVKAILDGIDPRKPAVLPPA